jgi:3',5'-cyclic AMP phosphodiesterase CpdA
MKFRFLIIIFLYLFFAPKAHAASNNQFVTVVNPVRVSNYNQSLVKSIQAQYGIIKQYHLPATWLLTYDSINDPRVVSEIKTFNSSQEIGIFLEVTPDFAKNAGITYHDSGSWHYATSVFLSGYKNEERIKLIDTVFAKYKAVFGKYPSSVGAWWDTLPWALLHALQSWHTQHCRVIKYSIWCYPTHVHSKYRPSASITFWAPLLAQPT